MILDAGRAQRPRGVPLSLPPSTFHSHRPPTPRTPLCATQIVGTNTNDKQAAAEVLGASSKVRSLPTWTASPTDTPCGPARSFSSPFPQPAVAVPLTSSLGLFCLVHPEMSWPRLSLVQHLSILPFEISPSPLHHHQQQHPPPTHPLPLPSVFQPPSLSPLGSTPRAP